MIKKNGIKKNWISIVSKIGINKSLKKQIQDHRTLIQKIKNRERKSHKSLQRKDHENQDESLEDESPEESPEDESPEDESPEKRNNDEIMK